MSRSNVPVCSLRLRMQRGYLGQTERYNDNTGNAGNYLRDNSDNNAADYHDHYHDFRNYNYYHNNIRNYNDFADDHNDRCHESFVGTEYEQRRQYYCCDKSDYKADCRTC